MSIPVNAGLLQSILNVGAAIAGSADAAKRQAQLVEFQKAITQAFTTIAELQLEKSALLSDKQELEKECVRLKDWAGEKQKYERREVAPGVFAQIEKNFVGDIQSAHKLCCNCFSKTIESTLQQNQTHDAKVGRMISLACSNRCPPITFRSYL